MIVLLPNNVRKGDKVSIQPDVLSHGASAEIMPKNLTGTVVSIPKHRRFAVVQYGKGDKCFCETIPIAPPEERLAHIVPREEEPTGWHNNCAREECAGQRKIRAYREARKMSQGAVAAQIGVTGPTISKWERELVPADWELFEVALPGVTEYAKSRRRRA